jgi:ribonuclease III
VNERLRALESRLGYTFTDIGLLAQAVVHRSWSSEHAADPPNERLEFLGDAVLGLIVTDHAYRRFPSATEGELAKIRAGVVNAVTLAEVASELSLGEALRVGRGEEQTGGRAKPSILADAIEAVIGAMYLDGGMEPAAALVIGLLGERIDQASTIPGRDDFKTRLQELAARSFDDVPHYHVTSDGPDHAKRFRATVSVAGLVRGRGEGRSKKEAEQVAARQACTSLAGSLERSHDADPSDGRPLPDRGDVDEAHGHEAHGHESLVGEVGDHEVA